MVGNRVVRVAVVTAPERVICVISRGSSVRTVEEAAVRGGVASARPNQSLCGSEVKVTATGHACLCGSVWLSKRRYARVESAINDLPGSQGASRSVFGF